MKRIIAINWNHQSTSIKILSETLFLWQQGLKGTGQEGAGGESMELPDNNSTILFLY